MKEAEWTFVKYRAIVCDTLGIQIQTLLESIKSNFTVCCMFTDFIIYCQTLIVELQRILFILKNLKSWKLIVVWFALPLWIWAVHIYILTSCLKGLAKQHQDLTSRHDHLTSGGRNMKYHCSANSKLGIKCSSGKRESFV